MKLFGKCSGCKKKRFFIKKPKILLPNGLKAIGRELLCNGCTTKLRLEIKP